MREEAGNQIELATRILEDRELYYLAQSVRILVGPGRAAYLDILHQHSMGPEKTAQWQACRSGGGWQRAVREYAFQSVSDDLESTLALEPGRYTEEVQQARADNFLCIMVELMAQRTWQQAERSLTLPDLLYTFFDPDKAKARAGIAKARKVWEAVLHAVRVRESGNRGKKRVAAVLADCYFAEKPMVKEMMLWLQRPALAGEFQS